jgi:hypothetical protein
VKGTNVLVSVFLISHIIPSIPLSTITLMKSDHRLHTANRVQSVIININAYTAVSQHYIEVIRARRPILLHLLTPPLPPEDRLPGLAWETGKLVDWSGAANWIILFIQNYLDEINYVLQFYKPLHLQIFLSLGLIVTASNSAIASGLDC